MYTVYLRTNSVNEKQYVGQTKNFRNRNKKWICLKEVYANLFLTEEREKYGLENFKTEILAEVETQEEAWELEKKFIKEYNTEYPNGYNKSIGGPGNGGCLKGIKFNEEHKRKLSEAMKGKQMGEEAKMKISKIHKGKTISNEHRNKISKTLSKIVLQIDIISDEVIKEWSGTREIERELGFSHENISACCRGKQKTAFGFKWQYKNG